MVIIYTWYEKISTLGASYKKILKLDFSIGRPAVWPAMALANDLPVFSLEIPGRVACSFSCTPNIALILLALASIPSSCRLATVRHLCEFSFRLRNTLPGALVIVVSIRNRSTVDSSFRLAISSFRSVSVARRLRPDRRLWLRLMCTSTPGFRGHRGAGVGCTGAWAEWEDTAGLGGPPSGLCNH